MPGNEVKINVTTIKRIKIQKLKSNTLYIIKIRAGRQADGVLQWSNYKEIRTRTIQKGIGMMSWFLLVPYFVIFKHGAGCTKGG